MLVDEAVNSILKAQECDEPPYLSIVYLDTGFSLTFGQRYSELGIILDTEGSEWKRDFEHIYLIDIPRHTQVLFNLCKGFAVSDFEIFSDLQLLQGKKDLQKGAINAAIPLGDKGSAFSDASIIINAIDKLGGMFLDYYDKIITQKKLVISFLAKAFEVELPVSLIIKIEDHPIELTFGKWISLKPLAPVRFQKTSINQKIDFEFYVTILLSIFSDFGIYELRTHFENEEQA